MIQICGVNTEKMEVFGGLLMEKTHPKQNEQFMDIILGLLEMVIGLNIILRHIMRCIRVILTTITMVHTINLFITLEDIIMAPIKVADIILMLEKGVLFMGQGETKRGVEVIILMEV